MNRSRPQSDLKSRTAGPAGQSDTEILYEQDNRKRVETYRDLSDSDSGKGVADDRARLSISGLRSQISHENVEMLNVLLERKKKTLNIEYRLHARTSLIREF